MPRRRHTPDSLRPDKLAQAPVWEFTNDEETEDGELTLRPVPSLPVRDLDNRLAGIEIRLADGSRRWALLSNVSLNAPELTRHFLTISVWCGDRWFPLARYHDVAHDQFGPPALAAALEKPMSDVFPLRYDLSSVAQGDVRALRGTVEDEPDERLSRAELIALAVRGA